MLSRLLINGGCAIRRLSRVFEPIASRKDDRPSTKNIRSCLLFRRQKCYFYQLMLRFVETAASRDPNRRFIESLKRP